MSTEYTKTNWQDGDIITADKMNNIENGIKGIEEATTHVKEELDEIISYNTQYLDSSLWESGKYYRAANAVSSVSDQGYAVYPALELKAGKYYYSRVNTGFTYGTTATKSSFKPFSSTNGIIEFDEDITLYITCQYPTTDFNLCMLANGVLPSTYVFGMYGLGVSVSNISKNIKIVDAEGYGDYTDIQSAINDCQDLNRYNAQTGVHETIIVMPGTYPRFSMGAGGNQIIPRRNISIIGIDRKTCIVRDDGGLYKYPPAEIRTDGTIANLTFIATHDSGDASTTESKDQYAVHLDYGWCDEVFENCEFISYCNAAVGIGLYGNQNLTFRNCTFRCFANSSEWGGSAPNGIYCHSNNSNGTLNQKLTIIDSESISENGTGGVFQIISGTEDSTEYLTLIRTLFWGNGAASVNIYPGWDLGMSYGNNVTI